MGRDTEMVVFRPRLRTFRAGSATVRRCPLERTFRATIASVRYTRADRTLSVSPREWPIRGGKAAFGTAPVPTSGSVPFSSIDGNALESQSRLDGT